MQYNKEQRERISTEAKGKIIETMEYDEEGGYWVITFTDGSEMTFRFMAELS